MQLVELNGNEAIDEDYGEACCTRRWLLTYIF